MQLCPENCQGLGIESDQGQEVPEGGLAPCGENGGTPIDQGAPLGAADEDFCLRQRRSSSTTPLGHSRSKEQQDGRLARHEEWDHTEVDQSPQANAADSPSPVVVQSVGSQEGGAPCG